MVVDGGLSFNKLGGIPDVAGELEQRRIKGELIAEATAASGVDAMALGPADWELGVASVQSWVQEHDLPVLAANLTCDGVAPYAGGKVVEAGGHRIGIVGVTLGEVEGCDVSDPHEAITRAAAALEGDPGFIVALVPASSNAELAEVVPQGTELPVDVVLDGRGRPAMAGPEGRAGALFMGAGSRGKSMGLMFLDFDGNAERTWVVADPQGVQDRIERTKRLLAKAQERVAAAPTPEAGERYKAQVLAYTEQLAGLKVQLEEATAATGDRLTFGQADLDASVPDHEATAALVSAAKQQITKAASHDPRTFVPRVVESGPFAGGEACVACHRAQHVQWSTTGHARAWKALVDDDRAFDNECWSCHVTGAQQAGGPASPREAAGFHDVQCEACHGPARAHVEAPGEVKPVRTPPLEVCTGCHDGEQDGGRFDAATYLPKVAHPNPAP